MPRGVNLRYDQALLQGRLWTPQALLGTGDLKMWLSVDSWRDISASSAGAISSWRDRSGFGLHLTGAVGNEPTVANNGYTVTTPTAATKRFTTTSGMPATYDLAMVAYPDAAGGYRAMILTTSGNYPLIIQTGNNNIGAFSGASFSQFGSLTWPNQPGLGYLSVKSTTDVSFARDGTETLSAEARTIATSINPISICGTSGTEGFGKTNELVWMSASLPLWLRQKVEGYLAWKWDRLLNYGLVALLPATHPYKVMPPLI